MIDHLRLKARKITMSVLRPDHPMQPYLHWYQAWRVRHAIRAMNEFNNQDYDIAWAVITPENAAPELTEWDYHLGKREWGFKWAERCQQQTGGWIYVLDKTAPRVHPDHHVVIGGYLEGAEIPDDYENSAYCFKCDKQVNWMHAFLCVCPDCQL